jgi:hypothetical protein
MKVNPQKRRPKGSLGALQRGLFSMFQRHLEIVEEEDDLELITKAATAGVQIALAYMQVIELGDMAKEMTALEHLIDENGNGHGR